MRIKLFIILFIIIMTACKTGNHNEPAKSIPTLESTDSEIWKRDSCGCLGVRTEDMATKIIKENNLLNKSIREFEKHFGSPNHTRYYDSIVIFEYYINSICDNEKIRNGSDRCCIEFLFESNRLKEISCWIE